MFNGSVGALTLLHPLHANVGETVRLFFGVSGPILPRRSTSSRDPRQGLYLRRRAQPPLRGLQTVKVASGGAVIAEFKPEVPGNYTILDHAIVRAERGLAATLVVGAIPTRKSTLRCPNRGPPGDTEGP